jgi:hypothetical protein
MKHLKMLGIVAIAAAALTALMGAGTASATVLYSGGTKLGAGTKIEATGSNIVLKAGFATIECAHAEGDGKTSNQGGASETVEGNISNLSFTECNATVKVLKKGKLVIHHTSGSNGTVTSEGAEVTVAVFGTSCTYGTPEALNVGTLIGGSPATMSGSASVKRIAGGFLCANPASVSASGVVTTPSPLEVKES